MSDSFAEANAGSGGVLFDGDSVGNEFIPFSKVVFGAMGTRTLVATDAGLPVQPQTGSTWAVTGTFFQATQPVSLAAAVGVTGTFWQATQPVSLASVPSHEVTNAGTFAVQAAQSGTWNVGTVTTLTGITNAVVVNGGAGQTSDIKVTLDSESIAVTGTFWQATQPVSGTFWQATQPVSGTFWQATQPVSLASVPSHAVTNAGTFAVQAAQSGTWNVSTVTTVTAVTAITNALPSGDNNIGNVDLVSFPPGFCGQQIAAASLSVVPGTTIADATYIGDIKFGESLPAGTALVGQVAASIDSASIMAGTTAMTPKFAAISGATNGDNTLVAAVNPKKIRVLALSLVSAGTTTVRFESGAGGTALTGVMSFIANTGMVLPFNPVGWFETASNTLLNMELNAATQVSGCLTYVEVA